MKFLGNIKNGAVLQRDKEIIINGASDEDKLLCVLKGGSYFEEWEVTPDANGKFKVEFSPVSDIKNRFTLGLYGKTEKNRSFGQVRRRVFNPRAVKHVLRRRCDE